MAFFEWLVLVLKTAFSELLDIAQTIIFLLIIGAGLFTYLSGVKMAHDLGGWAVAAIVLGTIVCLRLILAPYWLWQEDRQKISALSQSIADLNAQGPKFDVHIEDVAWGGQSTNPEYQNVVIAVATVTIKNLGRMPSVATGWNLTALRDGKTYQARLIAAQGPITMSMPRRADGKIISAVYPPEEFIVRKTSAPIQIGALVQGYIFGTFSDLDSTRTDLKLIVTCVDVLGKSYEASQNLVGRYDEPTYLPQLIPNL